MKGPNKYNSVRDAVANRLLTLMQERNLTQYKLAQLSGVPFSTLKGIMQRNCKGVSLGVVILLAKGLRMTPWEFLKDDSFLADNLDLDYNF